MAVYGGLRARLIKDSLYHMIEDAIADLGWFDAGRQHAPIAFRADPVNTEEEVPVNTLTLSDEDMIAFDQELGSRLAEHSWAFFLDFYAESNAIGIHMAQDLKAILEGRILGIGRGSTSFPVYDYRMATPAQIFMCEIDDVAVDRARNFPRAWQRYWYMVSFTVVDFHSNDFDDESSPPPSYYGGGYGE